MKYDVTFKDVLLDIHGNEAECQNSFYVDAVNYVEAMQKACKQIKRIYKLLPDHLNSIHDLEVKELS